MKDQGDALKQLLELAEDGPDLRDVGSCWELKIKSFGSLLSRGLATVFASLGQEPLVYCAADKGCERLAREVCQRRLKRLSI